MNCKIKKDGKKWVVVLENNKITFKGNTRKSCFMYCNKNNIEITAYQHGGI